MDQSSLQSTLSSISAKRKRHTLIAQLKACAQRKDLQTGSRLHAEMVQEGLLERDLLAGSVLISMYAKCGSLTKARQVFDNLSARNVVSWNALISGYAQHGHGKEAWECFGWMQREGTSPDAVTFVGILKACGCIGAADKGEEIHARLAKEGLLQRANVGHALVDMYAKCGLLSKAQEVFDMLAVRDVVSWNTLISGYSQHGYGEEALNCFGRMKFEGISPDPVTFVSILKACSSMKAAHKGQEIHAEIAKKCLLEKDAFIGTALVDMYARCGLLTRAQTVFDKLPLRDVVSWNALITGYVQNGNMKGALNCFERMQLERDSPNAVTYVCVLKACASTGASDKGQEVHTQVASKGLLERNVLVGTALVDMYAKCGMLSKAQDVFDKLPVRDVVAWSALIAGYTQIGKTESVFYTFDKMIEEGMKPDLVTFSSLLNACSHAGLLDKGQVYFESMCKDYGISPTLEHYTCMVDLLCRTGLLDKAVALVKEMPLSVNFIIWFTLLSACQKWGNIELGEYAFEHAVDLDEKHPGPYICMYDIYTDAGRQEDADKIEALRVKKQAWKKPV